MMPKGRNRHIPPFYLRNLLIDCNEQKHKNYIIMKSTFYVDLNMKTADNFENYGRFFIGNDPDFAYTLFSGLKGSKVITEEDILHIGLVELQEGLPVNISVINCTLEELTENCRIISKEMFKLLNLENRIASFSPVPGEQAV
jgi:hypothetical protein